MVEKSVEAIVGALCREANEVRIRQVYIGAALGVDVVVADVHGGSAGKLLRYNPVPPDRWLGRDILHALTECAEAAAGKTMEAESEEVSSGE